MGRKPRKSPGSSFEAPHRATGYTVSINAKYYNLLTCKHGIFSPKMTSMTPFRFLLTKANNMDPFSGDLGFICCQFHLQFRITASMNTPDDPASRDLRAHSDGNGVTLGMKSRAYFGNRCADGDFRQSEYMKVPFGW